MVRVYVYKFLCCVLPDRVLEESDMVPKTTLEELQEQLEEMKRQLESDEVREG